MAEPERIISKESTASATLIEKLAAVLPKGSTFKIHHLSTPPTRTSALYSLPPGTRPERTYCESHFLAASIPIPPPGNGSESTELLVFAIEVLIYSTAYSNTFFVSKADSTGYLHLLDLPKSTPSPLRDISGTFLRHLVQQRHRQNTKSIISLFARAQDQYLFPGSVENNGKHVLDDRGLVRWWCRVLNPLVEPPNSSTETPHQSDSSPWQTVKGYLIIPGLDTYETSSYIPSQFKPPSESSPWTIGHPLQGISRYSSDVPPRCLIPHFPDDPKSRFLDELDDEISKGTDSGSGQWKSVKSIDQFWDMMAFRQECSAGRLVGFIWVVFNPAIQHNSAESAVGDSQQSIMTTDSALGDHNDSAFFSSMPDNAKVYSTPDSSTAALSQTSPTSSPSKLSGSKVPAAFQQSTRSKIASPLKRKKLSGPIVARQPRIKKKNKNYLLERPENTAYYKWNAEGRGQIIVEEVDYKRITELLLRLDFANVKLATSSSKRWINEVRSGAWGSTSNCWGQAVVGTKVVEIQTNSGTTGVNTLTIGLVRKKRKEGVEGTQETSSSSTSSNKATAQVNVLGAGMIRKKLKV